MVLFVARRCVFEIFINVFSLSRAVSAPNRTTVSPLRSIVRTRERLNAICKKERERGWSIRRQTRNESDRCFPNKTKRRALTGPLRLYSFDECIFAINDPTLIIDDLDDRLVKPSLQVSTIMELISRIEA